MRTETKIKVVFTDNTKLVKLCSNKEAFLIYKSLKPFASEISIEVIGDNSLVKLPFSVTHKNSGALRHKGG